jgi:hypothetical protein
MPDEVFSWSLATRDGAIELMRFDEAAHTLQQNGTVATLEPHAAKVLGVLLRHPDAPVTTDDFLEAGLQTKGGGTVKKALKVLQRHPLAGRHVLQIGENASAVYAFITNPDDAQLLTGRMQEMHDELYGGDQTMEAEKSNRRLRKAMALAGAIGSAAAGYMIVRHVHRKK